MHAILPVLVACVLLLVGPYGAVVSAPMETTPPVAGLVVSYGDGAISYATVPLDGERMDGVTLLERSGLDVVAIDFGGYGQGVCKIEIAGCDVSACRTRLCQTADSASPFWKYLLGGDAGWTLSPLGASGTTIEAGHVYGWAWAGGTGVPADMPQVSLAEVMSRSGYQHDAGTSSSALRSIGLPSSVTSRAPSPDTYLWASLILVAVAGGGFLLVRRASRRTGVILP
ncbi:MAG: hypothetical protein WBA46_12820 [Thermomicrobiales bacterium]